MPLKLPDGLPAIETLRAENIFVMNQKRAESQDIRPLRIVILNLMPIKEVTENDLIRLLSNTPLQIEIDFLMVEHISKNTCAAHLEAFYKSFNDIRANRYDGMIVTGAPVEQLDFEQVNYWKEITEIFDWSKTHVTSTMFICWAALAGLNYLYGIPKYPLTQKLSGVFEHTITHRNHAIFRGFDDTFFVPHSRHSTIHEEDIAVHPELTILAKSEEAGVYMVSARDGREFFLMGHAEYGSLTLDAEYRRDLEKDINIPIPKNYYPNNNPSLPPIVRWRGHAHLLFANWLNYFVYQETPYKLDHIA